MAYGKIESIGNKAKETIMNIKRKRIHWLWTCMAIELRRLVEEEAQDALVEATLNLDPEWVDYFAFEGLRHYIKSSLSEHKGHLPPRV